MIAYLAEVPVLVIGSYPEFLTAVTYFPGNKKAFGIRRL